MAASPRGETVIVNARLAAFLHDDVDHVPFGLEGLRGLTPARLGFAKIRTAGVAASVAP